MEKIPQVNVSEIITVDLEEERRNLRRNRVVLVSSEIDAGGVHEFIEDMEVILHEPNTEPITIIFASPGGEAFAGMSMLRVVRKAQKMGIKVIGQVYGYACSMACILLQACDERIMGKLDVLMVHGVTSDFEGDMRGLDSQNKLLTFWHHELAELIASRCSNAKSEDGELYNEAGYWYEILRDNTPQWYTSEEAKEMGLIDKIDDATD
jgi:ATP-dependent protease ClpP protease subunit